MKVDMLLNKRCISHKCVLASCPRKRYAVPAENPTHATYECIDCFLFLKFGHIYLKIRDSCFELK